MDLLQLKYFQTVARLENITQAALTLHIAQPSLSKAIGRLENDLGVKLFDRRGRGIVLNQFGKLFLVHADQIFQQLEQARQEVREAAGLERGVVVVGATATRLLPDLFADFSKAYPMVTFKLLHLTNSEVVGKLEAGEIDLCISTPAIVHRGIECRLLLEEEIYLATRKNVCEGATVNLADFSASDFVSLTSDYDLREMTINLCKEAGFVPNIAFESNDPAVVCKLVANGLGSALIPCYWWKDNQNVLPEKRLIKSPECRRRIWLSWVEARSSSIAAVKFRQFLLTQDACRF